MVSIIIPAHNEKENLESLLSVLVDIAGDVTFEVLIALSCGNTDGTENLDLNESTRIVKCTEKGRAVQMNTAASMAKGNILAFLHADVTPSESFFRDIERTLANGYDAGFFSYRFDKKSVFLRINAFFTARDGIFTGGGDQCLFIKTPVFRALNGFDEQQVLMEDFEFFRRMKKKGVRYKIVKSDLIVSARKFKDNSYLKVNLSNFLLVLLFKCGYPAGKLKSLHDRLIKMSYR